MFDLDGVFFSYGDSLKSYMDHIGIGHLWKSGPTKEPIWEFYTDWGMSLDDFISLNNDAADAGFLFTGPMRPGGKEAWDTIANTGHEIVIATDRSFGSTPESSEKNTLQWLDEHNLYYDELIFTNDKTRARCDIAIDDKPSNVLALEESGTTTFLMDRPWNKSLSWYPRRISQLSEFVDAVGRAHEGFDAVLT